MPGLEVNFFRILFRSDGIAQSVPTTNNLYYKQKLLNIPTHSHGEEYVKKYVDRFGAR